MSDDILRYDVRDEVAFVEMNRPNKLNALSVELADALNDTWSRFEADPLAKVAILSGAGRAFCAGADIGSGGPNDDLRIPWAIRVHRAYPQNGVTVFKPIIGAVHGYALGGGWALAVRGCDITIAGESAMFGFPEPRVGISIPPIDYLPYVPFKASLEFMLLAWNGGEMLDARRAHELGMVNRVVSDADLMNEAIRWAGLLKKIPPMYIKAIKYGHYKAVESKTARDEREYLNFSWPQEVSEDSREGRRAFKEKRAPRFKGR